jgi:nucleoside-diphosphate-sugar epimerase
MTVALSAPNRVFIAGATGSLGTAMVGQFQKKGWQVVGTYRSEEDGERLRGLGVEAVRADVTDMQGLRAIAAGLAPVQSVVMNAGLLSADSAEGLRSVNARGPDNLMRAFAEAGKLPPNVVHISSQLVGGPDARTQAPEDRYRVGGGNPVSDYARSKASGEGCSLLNYQMATTRYWKVVDSAHPGNGEMLHRTPSAEASLGFVSLRPAGILGARDMVTTKPMIDGLRGLVIGALHLVGIYPNVTTGPDPEISVVSDEDVAYVAAHIAADNQERIAKGKAPRFGVYDVENGEGALTQDKIVAAGKKVFGTKWILTPKLPVLKISAFLNEEVAKRLSRARKKAAQRQRAWEDRREAHEDKFSTVGQLADGALGFMGGAWNFTASLLGALLKPFAQVRTVDYSRVPELSHPNLATSNARLYEAYPELNPAVSRRNFKRFEDILRDVKAAWGLS